MLYRKTSILTLWKALARLEITSPVRLFTPKFLVILSTRGQAARN